MKPKDQILLEQAYAKILENKKENTVKISVVRKVETDEWVAKVYINGKYNEDATYYTDDKEDAITTKDHMLKSYEEKGYKIVGK